MIHLQAEEALDKLDLVNRRIKRYAKLLNDEAKTRDILERALIPIEHELARQAPVGERNYWRGGKLHLRGTLKASFYTTTNPWVIGDESYGDSVGLKTTSNAFVYARANGFYWKFINRGFYHVNAGRRIAGTKFLDRSIAAQRQTAYKLAIQGFEREFNRIK